MEPTKQFVPIFKYNKFVKKPNDDGIEPTRDPPLQRKLTKLDMLPIEDGMLPNNTFPLTSKAVTAPEVHVTPVHAGEHTSLRGVLPEQRHPVRPVILQRFVD